MAMRQLCRQLRLQLAAAEHCRSPQQQQQQQLQQLKLGGWQQRHSSSAGGTAKKADQMSEDELRAALPSMLFTTSNLIWSTTLAVGVATAGLLCMFYVGSWITGAAQSLRHLDPAPPPPPPAKTLAELVSERKAELQAQLQELEGLPRTPEVKVALSETRRELRQFREPGSGWWQLW